MGDRQWAKEGLPVAVGAGCNGWALDFAIAIARIDQYQQDFVTLLSLVIVMWWIIDPTVASTGGDGRWIFLILNGLLVAFGAAAGWLGGKLVFKDA